ncbi:transcription-associated protein 1 [Malassezia sp. CBS 17886]|nr:transcription-associated protein 1 [Malassezia sp. CBS 17886]
MAGSDTGARAAHAPDASEFARKLGDASLDARAKAAVVAEIKEMVEVFVNVDYVAFLNAVLPVQMDLLERTPCAFVSDAPEQRLRHSIVEAIYRYPQHDAVRTHAERLMQVMLRAVQDDNEDNATLAFKVIIDLHRSFKAVLQPQVQPFLELVQKLYLNMRAAVADAFGTEQTPGAAAPVAAEGDGALLALAGGEGAADGTASPTVSRPLLKSAASFKVLTECPIAIVLIFQTYRNVVNSSINVFVPLIFEHCLMLQALPQQQAHDAARARGEIFVGVAPGIRNRTLFSDMVTAQVKTMSFLAYVLRGSAPIVRQYVHLLPEVNVRLLKDCPPENAVTRKELLVATRHILSTDFREHFVAQIDTLLDERVLLGTGVTTRELHRPLVVSMLADLMHHVRQELSTEQVVRTVNLHAQLLHDPTLAPSIQTMCVKLLLNLVETIVVKHAERAVPLLRGILDTFLAKLPALHRLCEDVRTLRALREDRAAAADGAGAVEVAAVRIEQAKAVQSSVAVLEHVADPLKNARFLFRNLLFGFKTLITVLKHRGVPEPDGAVMGRVFEGGVRCCLLQDQRDGREEKDMIDLFTNIFIDLQPETFHEVFATHMPFLFDEILAAPVLLGIPQNLLSNDAVSRRFVDILLQFLVARLEMLGTSDKKLASVSLRLFKMAFMAVTIFPEENEVVLQPHLTHLIMHSLECASKAEEPANFFLVLRALFRSIGGGRFELLYKDVLPLLPVLLKKLNVLLDAAEPSRREVFIDLCLTVPVRLSVLLPYLDQLMHPLVLALQSSPELVSQGLRTLELCIDNLTQEFLDPIMAPYIQDIMAALWSHLKPLPHSHQHSHTTMRILGKLGGRNRRFLQQPPALQYRPAAPPMLALPMNGSAQPLDLLPTLDAALAQLPHADAAAQRAAFDVLTAACTVLVAERATPREHHAALRRAVVGLFHAGAAHVGVRADVRAYLLGLYAHAMRAEIERDLPHAGAVSQRHLLPLTLVLLEAMARAVDGVDVRSAEPHVDLLLAAVHECVAVCDAAHAARPGMAHTVMHALASAFCSLCYEQHWHRRLGGWLGIDTLVRRAGLGSAWTADHQLEIVRALLYMLKDMPSDPPRDIGAVSDTLYCVLEQAYGGGEDGGPGGPERGARGAAGGSPAGGAAPPGGPATRAPARPTHLTYLVGILIPELSCANEIARTTTQHALELLATLRACAVTDLLVPQRDRLLLPIFTKPLRALPFGIQIGHIDAITYTLRQGAPLPEFNEELFRVLTEALALADADDQALLGRASMYKSVRAVTKLRVAALRLLAAAMGCAAFGAQEHTAMRMRIIAVYFKCLYSQSEAVVQVAYDSLKATLAQQSKLPKDLLRSGLQPILMTLADRNRLTTASLDGLARLLQLLTNYFKVEIGMKLLDHLTALADPQMLRRAAGGSLDTHEQLNTLAAIVRVFHLLPDTAYQFLPRLPLYVAEIESHLRRVGPTPFTDTLVLYLDRFAEHTVRYFFDADRVCMPKFFRLLRLALASPRGATLRAELAAHDTQYLLPLLADASPPRVHAALEILEQLVRHDDRWLVTHTAVRERLLALWHTPAFHALRRAEADVLHVQPRTTHLFVFLFESVLRAHACEDVLFALLDLYTFPHPLDLTPYTRKVYELLCVRGTPELQRTVVRRAVALLGEGDASPALRTHALRLLVNPVLVWWGTEAAGAQAGAGIDAAAGDGAAGEEAAGDPAGLPPATVAPASPARAAAPLVDTSLLRLVDTHVWKPAQVRTAAATTDALRIELLHMSTQLLEHGAALLADDAAMKLNAIKFGWASLAAEDTTVKHSAYVFVARFLREFESPEKIVGQVYMGLLRLHQSDGRALVRRALDILVPALPTRVPARPGQPPPWVKWTRRALLDEGHNAAQLCAILQLIVRSPDLFAAQRELFVPHIVTSLGKLGLTSSAGAESKRLAVDLVALLHAWETPAAPRAKRQRTGTASYAETGDAYAMPLHLREMTVSFLVRFVSLSPEPRARNEVTKQAFALLEHMFAEPAWRSVPVRLAILQRALIHVEFSDAHEVPIANALGALDVVCRAKNAAWFHAHMAQLQKLLEKTLASERPLLLDAALPVLRGMFAVLPAAPPDTDAPGDDGAAFLAYAENLVADALRTSSGLHSALVVLQAWSDGRAALLDRHLLPLVKVLTRLTKEHLGGAAGGSAAGDGTLRLLRMVLSLLRTRISHMGDQRRWFLSAVVQLVEKSTSVELAHFLLAMMRTWILEVREPFPTVKEKAGILVKMLCFEQRNDAPLFCAFLQLILEIYRDPALARSELTARLESVFLLGCRNADAAVRGEFIRLFDHALTRSLSARLQHLLGAQSWEPFAEHYWLHQALDLLLAAVDGAQPLVASAPAAAHAPADPFARQLRSGTLAPFLTALRALQYDDVHAAHRVWTDVFAGVWRATPRRHQGDVNRALIGCVVREYMVRQATARPNVVQSLLDGALACRPALELPPHVLQYLSKTFQTWHTGMELLQNQLLALRQDDAVRESTQDALAEVYAELSEADYFYGLWRRRCVFGETNVALAYEQNGMYAESQLFYEAAQVRGRTSGLPLTEAEYNLWDDHWVLSALELQQWDILTDLAKLEHNEDLALECAWRLADWTTECEALERSLESVAATATPRRKVFEAYIALLKSQAAPEKPSDFGRICDEAIQLTLYKWYTLPTHVSQAHVPLLQIFQQFVELQEVSTVFASLAHTNATNLSHRSAELKTLMQTWRERLPNLWDDINAWSDLVAWRQHVFSAVNKAYLPLVPLIQRTEGPGSSTNSYAYRGYHEIAWIINRFAHVARKHDLADVCISSLTKIYTLPNIEIQEAFLKLREQARCHYHNPNELMQGLNVINNTNLMFFAAAQKAEFFSLKGMFLNRLGFGDEANQAFATAIQMDLNLPKSWTEWGRYSDRLFREKPGAMHLAANAISCYLQAAGLYKNAKARKILVRVLWLLSCDDAQGTLWQACDSFNGETPVWYWITFIPQLLQLLAHKDAKFVRKLLMQIAKSFPQSLYYYLRTTKEDYLMMKRNSAAASQRAAARQKKDASTDDHSGDAAAKDPSAADASAAPRAPADTPADEKDAAAAPHALVRQPWDHIDDILNILKTAFPLLALTMENMADQLQQRFKPSNDEDIYRLTNALLNDALQQYIHRAPLTTDNGQLPQTSQMNVTLFAENLPPGPLKTAFENDFVRSKPNLREYVARLQRWRDRYEESLDRRPKRQHLEHCSHYLVEFQHQKFDDVEIPGQYLHLEDSNANFVRIARFLPEYGLLRSNGMCNRRITILSNKGSLHSFAVQLPSARYCRREERIFQLLRLLNTVLERKIQTRKRGLAFNVPTAVPISPQLRLLNYDESFVSMQDIYEAHCKEIGIGKDDPIVAWVEKMRSTWHGASHRRTNVDFANLRMELMEEISVKMISDKILSNYMIRTMSSPSDLWLMRKQFTLQMATTMFLTYILFVSARFPGRIHISRSSGAVIMSDVVPTFSPTAPHFKSPDPTPFRLSPNIQHFIGAVGIEGIVTCAFMALGGALALPEHGLEDFLGIFVRDELQFWFSGAQRQVPKNVEPTTEIVMQNVFEIVKRARLMSCKYGHDKVCSTY